MSIKNTNDQKLILVCIFDPLPLDKIKIDQIRQEGLFEFITEFEGNAILLANQVKKVQASVQLTRLEYTDINQTEFEKRSLDLFEKLLQVLPPLRIKAIGINLHYTLVFDNDIIAAEFVRDKFLKNQDTLQNTLAKPIIGSSIRFFYGAPDEHFDVRIYTLELKDKDVQVSLHKHKDVDIAMQDLLIKTTREMFYDTCAEKIKLANKIF